MTGKKDTKKGAASIYIVIFTTTLLGIIALSFVRIMLAESLRTTNYSLSQSAYNSALAGVEDAKIVLLRNQSCINKGNYTSSKGSTNACDKYRKLFMDSETAFKTAEDCNIVGNLLHGTKDTETETLIQTREGVDTGTIDQAYTCVKISAFTEDFLATLNDSNPTKIVPLRAESKDAQDSINRIQIQWFDDNDYRSVSDNNVLKNGFTGFWKNSNKSDLTGTTKTNKGNYALTAKSDLGNNFTEDPLVPPVLQVTMLQTAPTFATSQFYSSEGTGANSKTNRGTLMLRPTSSNDIKTTRGINKDNHSNMLAQNSLAYSANKSYNTPIDVYCEPAKPNTASSETWNYACSADFFVPKPIGSPNRDSEGELHDRNMATSFLVVNLPYGKPSTDISVKMYKCIDDTKSLTAQVEYKGETVNNCSIVYFANVQPTVDSTGRANDLFRRVESRIELADTNFPIANYALAMTDPANEVGIEKDFYVTNDCRYSSTFYDSDSNTIKNVYKNSQNANGDAITDGTKTVNQKRCADSGEASGGGTTNGGKGNGEH